MAVHAIRRELPRSAPNTASSTPSPKAATVFVHTALLMCMVSGSSGSLLEDVVVARARNTAFHAGNSHGSSGSSSSSQVEVVQHQQQQQTHLEPTSHARSNSGATEISTSPTRVVVTNDSGHVADEGAAAVVAPGLGLGLGGMTRSIGRCGGGGSRIIRGGASSSTTGRAIDVCDYGGTAQGRTLLASVGTPRRHSDKLGKFRWGGGATSPAGAAVAAAPNGAVEAAAPPPPPQPLTPPPQTPENNPVAAAAAVTVAAGNKAVAALPGNNGGCGSSSSSPSLPSTSNTDDFLPPPQQTDGDLPPALAPRQQQQQASEQLSTFQPAAATAHDVAAAQAAAAPAVAGQQDVAGPASTTTGASQQQAGASEVAGRAHRPEAPPSSPTAATAAAEVQAAPPIPTPTPEPGAAAATTTTITAMPGAVVGLGGVQIGAGGGDGGDRKAAVSAAGILTRLISAMVPELVRAAKFLAAVGIVLRVARWAPDVATRATRPTRTALSDKWQQRHQHQHQHNQPRREEEQEKQQQQQQQQQQREQQQRERERAEANSPRGEIGARGERQRNWRARESVLVHARGTRVPPGVVASLNDAEVEVAADLVDCDRLDVTFEDIAGMEDVKRSLQEIISEPLDFPPDLYPARLIKPCTGILIYGPPGCGKTLLAKAVAKQSGAAFISVKTSTLTRRPGGMMGPNDAGLHRGSGGNSGGGGGGSSSSGGGGGGAVGGHTTGGVGHSSVMVRAVFSLAQKIQPCIVFFDEADGLCFKREEGDGAVNREVTTELMQLWDDLSCSGQDRVVVLAATNRPWDLDPAVQRRFSRSFQVGLPDRKMRKAVLMKALEDVEVEEGFDWRELAVNTEGYSCGDVVELCREAVRGPLREAMDRNRRRSARRQNHGLHQSRLRRQQEQQQHQRRHRGEWQPDTGSMESETVAAAAASAEVAGSLPPVRMRPLRMSDVTSAQARVVPTFWQAEAYRATYDGYMCSLMDHARQNWSR
ncbi:unnamed protein product [Pylaiella littoralis]